MRTGFQKLIKKVVILSLLGFLVGQGSGYLAQKLMVENNIRQRVQDALSKIVDNNKYVINVDVDLEISDEVEEQITMLAPREKKEPPPPPPSTSSEADKKTSELQESITSETTSERSTYSVGLPIPGFEIEFTESDKAQKKAKKPEPPVVSVDTQEPVEITDSKNPEEPRVDKVYRSTRPSRAEIKKMYISLILQEGAAPELIENIRQLTMAASKFDRNRGDKLTIMTASFKEKRDQRSAEQIMLKNIAEKIELLEEKRVLQERHQDSNWKKDLTRYREEETIRREEDRRFFEGQISQLEEQAKEKAYEQEKKEMLMRDSLKLKKLNDEILALRAMLRSAEKRDSLETLNKQAILDSLRYENLSSDLDNLAQSLQSAMEKESKEEEKEAEAKIMEEINIREREKEERDAEIAAKIKDLDNVQAELDRLQQDMEKGMDSKAMVLIGIGALAVVLMIILIVAVLRGPKQPPTPPWMYPPPPRKPRSRKKSTKEEDKPKKEEPKEEPKEPEAVTAPSGVVDVTEESTPDQPSSTESSEQETAPPPLSDDDPDVVRSEIEDIRKSVVSMSVGQPERTTTIVKEWLEQPAPPEPESPSEEAAGEDAVDKEEKK